MEAQLTPTEYAAKMGMVCPFCLGSSMTTGHMQHDEQQAWMSVTCQVCGKEWNDVYQLTGYETEVE